VKKAPLVSLVFLLTVSTAFAQESHKVQPNQTLYSIARLYNISVDQLRAWNSLDTAAIRVGQSLVVKPAAKTALVNPGLNPFLYTVRAGDSLGALSVKFDTSLDTLYRINGLTADQGLYVGQRVYIRHPVGVTFYTVQTGDSLANLAALFDIAQEELIAINQLTGTSLTPGATLRVFKPSEVPLNHTVAASDTPAGIAALYGLSVAELQRINGTDSLALKAGQVLKLRAYASAAQRVFQPPVQEKVVAQKSVKTYVVQKGDSLLKLTREYGIRLDDLLYWNGMAVDGVLHVGQVINLSKPTSLTEAVTQAVAPSMLPKSQVTVSFPEEAPKASPAAASPADLPAFRDEDQAKIRWDSYVVLDKAIPVFEWNADYYYWTHPGELSQPNRGYYENNWISPVDAFQKARQLISKFDALVAQKGPLSTILQGYTVVIDPGHGGLDPGAIVKASDEDGKTVYLTEHEYVYDISLRIYALLKRHGADARMTILAPSHLIRDTSTGRTLVNEKNQVYNDLALNQSDDAEAWPNGSQAGLDKRITIADRAFRTATPGRRVFLSLHADNNPASPYGTGVLALETREGSIDTKSLNFAQKLLPYLGSDAYARTQNLAVLRGNDADYKVLVEVHNLASDGQSQAMQAGSSRQLSAQKIVRGILEAFRK